MIGERDVIDARREEMEAEYFGSLEATQHLFSALDPIWEAACDDEDLAAELLGDRPRQPVAWVGPLVVEPIDLDVPF